MPGLQSTEGLRDFGTFLSWPLTLKSDCPVFPPQGQKGTKGENGSPGLPGFLGPRGPQVSTDPVRVSLAGPLIIVARDDLSESVCFKGTRVTCNMLMQLCS